MLKSYSERNFSESFIKEPLKKTGVILLLFVTTILLAAGAASLAVLLYSMSLADKIKTKLSPQE